MSQLIERSDVLRLGIEEIDNQHKDLLDQINEIRLAIRDRQSRHRVLAALARLAADIKIHFAVEESLMRILGYPGFEGHRAQHEQLLRNLLQLQGRVEGGNTAIGLDLASFLTGWLTNHILAGDRQYGEFFINAGVKARYRKTSWATRRWDSLHD